MGRLRASLVLAGFFGLTLPLMPLQAALLRFSPQAARRLPHWYHRRVCRILGIRLHITGEVAPGAALIVANHTSWLDIPVLSALAPVSFVAKREVGNWPFVASLARLQRTVLVDRERRASAGDTAGEMLDRLAGGDKLVLFPEGTSSDGNRVLPFRSALFAAVKPSQGVGAGAAPAKDAVVQTVAIVYTRLHGLPLGRSARSLVGWFGDMEMGSHAWELLQAGPLDVELAVGPPVRLEEFADRKALALATEAEVRRSVTRILRARAPCEPLDVVMPEGERRSRRPPPAGNLRGRVFT
jgi:1-acyl-sn-glycerol-3-phosphate acyltransferase